MRKAPDDDARGVLRVAGVWAVALVALLPALVHADRVGSIEISVDGKPWLSAGYRDNGLPMPATVWRYLHTTELKPAAGVTIVAEPGDPLRATLRGKVTVDVLYGGKADVMELRLVRERTNAGWTVDPGDVERIAGEIGLGPEPTQPPRPRSNDLPAPKSDENVPWVWVALGGVVILAAVLLWVSGRRQDNSGR